MKSRGHNDLSSEWWSGIATFIARPLVEAENERKDYLDSQEGLKPDGRILTVLLTVAVLLTLQEYLLKADYFISFEGWIHSNFPDLAANLFSKSNRELSFHLYWALGQTLLYFVVPVIQILFFFRQPLSVYGLKARGFISFWGLYLAMLAIMVPIVLVVSKTDSFQATYPFYRGALGESLWPRFWIWEAAYFLQFMGLEFFFRGYLLHGVKRRFGAYAIFVMMVPYCMIHFGKPMPETFAAIAAGIILGFMSLKTRSIWMGAALHISVALTMDLCSLWRIGRFD